MVLALQHANRVLQWQENLQRDEMPPPWMWPFEGELEVWFEEVERKREARFGGGNDGGSADDSEGPMLQNTLSRKR